MLETGNNSGVLPSLTGVPLLTHAIPYEFYSDPERMKTTIDLSLFEIWESLLSDDEREEWSRWRAGNCELSNAAFRKLDALILKQAETFGWRLMLSPLVQLRFRASEGAEGHGSDFVRQFGEAVTRAARIIEGQEYPPVDETGLRQYKRECTQELSRLLKRLRPVLRRNRSFIPIKVFRELVLGSSDFRLLRENLDSWLEFLKDTEAYHLKQLAAGGRVTPATIFDEQRAWATGYDQETLRQKTSKLGAMLEDKD